MKNLCRALIWNACFLELSGGDVVDPDSAVKALEDMAASLQKATDEEKAAFIDACREEAERLRSDPFHSMTVGFIASLPRVIGLDKYADDDG